MYIFRMRDFRRMQSYGPDIAHESQGALLESSSLLCDFHFLCLIQSCDDWNLFGDIWDKKFFRYFHLFSTLEYYNTGLSRRMGPYLEALVCAATFPFTFCSAAWFSVEVVRSTIFEEMEGEVEGIVPPAAWLCNLQKDTRSLSCVKVVSKLSKRSPNVVSKLSQRCFKVVPKMYQSCPKLRAFSLLLHDSVIFKRIHGRLLAKVIFSEFRKVLFQDQEAWRELNKLR